MSATTEPTTPSDPHADSGMRVARLVGLKRHEQPHPLRRDALLQKIRTELAGLEPESPSAWGWLTLRPGPVYAAAAALTVMAVGLALWPAGTRDLNAAAPEGAGVEPQVVAEAPRAPLALDTPWVIADDSQYPSLEEFLSQREVPWWSVPLGPSGRGVVPVSLVDPPSILSAPPLQGLDLAP